MAYNSVQGRYFAGKQVKCEFVSLTRWKVAICGEFMKSRLKTCSRGSACNFLHCFSNPGGDYEWADCDKPPPRYWVEKMIALFGYSDDSWHEKQSPREQQQSSRIFTSDRDSYHSKRHRYIETNQHNESSSGQRHHDEKSRYRERKKEDRSNEDKSDYKSNHNIAEDTDSDGDQLDKNAPRRHRESSENHSTHHRRESRSRDYHDRSRRRTHGSSSVEDEEHKSNSRYHRRSKRLDRDEVDHQESENEEIKNKKRRNRKSASRQHRHERSRSRDSLEKNNEMSDRWEPDN